MREQKVLFITRKYPPSVGGMQKLSYELTTRIGRQVRSRVIYWSGSQRWLPLFLLLALARAVPMLMRNEVALLHLGDSVVTPLGIALRAVRRLPIVVNAHGLDVTYPHPLYQALVSFCLRRMDKVICDSKYTRDECVRRGVSPARCTVIPPGIDVSEYISSLPDAEREAWLFARGIPRNGLKVLLTCGRLVPRKGIAPFVANVLPLLKAQRQDWVYLIVGEGPERRAIEMAIQTNGLSQFVRLLGLLNDRDLKVAYAVADVFVMPNIPVPGDPEGFGIVILEARASGVPVVASNLEGIRDAIGGTEEGTLVEPGDWKAFATAIIHWMNQSGKVAGRTLRQQRVREEFGWEHIISQHLHAFQMIQNAQSFR